MTRTTNQSPLHVALVGNPNTGKSTLFTALAGVRQRVGNYPGVTVEKKVGHLVYGQQRFALIDLPGTYSLAPRSPDEMVAVDVLLGRQTDTAAVDAVICIVDASNLERNLYLVSQVLELGLPTIIALNMVDVAQSRGIKIDVRQLEDRLGVLVVEIQAHRRIGIDKLKDALVTAAGRSAEPPKSPFPDEFCREVSNLQTRLNRAPQADGHDRALPRYLVERLLLDTSGYLEDRLLCEANGEVRQEVAAARLRDVLQELAAARQRLGQAGMQVPAIEAVSRYQWVGRVLQNVVTRPAEHPTTMTDRVDRVLANRFSGVAIFALMMVLVFQAVFAWAVPFMDYIDAATGYLGRLVTSAVPPGAVQSLLVDGVIGGVGGVIVFLPQILILFFFIGVLEDCGYMARAAYLMDKLMVPVGLSGKSFIPLLSSFACAVPGVMAARVIENRRDRLTTILVAPLMSCSARIPVYVLLIGTFIPTKTYLGGLLGLQSLTMVAMYVLGMVVAALAALVMKRTILRGPTPPFVMELPSYKWPSLRIVLYRMVDRGWAFVRRAGTLIVAVSILVWAALYYPHNAAVVEAPYRQRVENIEARLAGLPEADLQRQPLQEQLARVEKEITGAYNRQSILGRMGRVIEPLVRPLGWDWRIGCAVIASFPAREVVVATLGIIYDLGENVDIENTEDMTQLQSALTRATWEGTDRPVFNIPVAMSILVFFALCAQCAATLVTIRRETNSWGWPLLTFVYMTGLAYLGALVTYQLGMAIS